MTNKVKAQIIEEGTSKEIIFLDSNLYSNETIPDLEYTSYRVHGIDSTTSSSSLENKSRSIHVHFGDYLEDISELRQEIRDIKTEMENLKQEKTEPANYKLTKKQARKKIITYLKQKKGGGNASINVLEISSVLKIAPPQIEDIFEELQKKDILKEI